MNVIVRVLSTMKIMVPQVLFLFLFGKTGYSDSHPPKLSAQVTLPAGWIDISRGAPMENFTRCERESKGAFSAKELQRLVQDPEKNSISFVSMLPPEKLIFEVISTKEISKGVFLSKQEGMVNVTSQKNLSFSGIQVAHLKVNAFMKEGVQFQQNVYMAENRDFILTCTPLDIHQELKMEESCELIVKTWLEQTVPAKKKWVVTLTEKVKEVAPLLKHVGIEMIKWISHHTVHLKK